MELKVIGTGFGRTGTNSLKLSLEQLGFGPCHHMYEVVADDLQKGVWESIARGNHVDWDEVFQNYSSCIDWPAAHYWEELCEHYPNAKVLHSVRDEEKWISSMHKTILPTLLKWDPEIEGPNRENPRMAYEIIMRQTFDGKLDDREHALNVYRAHNKKVRSSIPQDRLLVYDVVQGWEPLCEFLEVPVPDSPFPRVNSADDFHQKQEI